MLSVRPKVAPEYATATKRRICLNTTTTVAPEQATAAKRRICLNATAVKGGYVNVAVKLRFTCQNFIGLIDDHATVFQNTTSMRKTPYGVKMILPLI